MHIYWTFGFCILTSLGTFLFFSWATKKEKFVFFVYEHPFWMIPDSICYIRTILGWLAICLYILTPLKESATILFSFACTLDTTDGQIARECDLITEKGKALDPLCDKLIYLPFLLYFALQGLLDTSLIWTLVIIEVFLGQFASREILQYLKKSVANTPGAIEKWSGAANNFGKIKQCVGFILIYYCIAIDNGVGVIKVGDYILIANIILSVLSIIFKFIPKHYYANILSLINLSFGLVSSCFVLIQYYAMSDLVYYYTGFTFIYYYVGSIFTHIIGVIFDLFDGKAKDEFGGTKHGELFDDCADWVNSGIYPALLIACYGNTITSAICGYIFYLCVSYRLIRFLKVDKLDKNFPQGIFKGLPCPAGSLGLVSAWIIWKDTNTLWYISAIISFLMISRIPFAHFRRVILDRIPKKYSPLHILLCVLLVILIAIIIKTKSFLLFGNLLFIISTIYIIGGPIIAKKELKKL